MRYENYCVTTKWHCVIDCACCHRASRHLVFWQLDSDPVTMHPLALRRMTYVPRYPTEIPEEHMTRWSKLPHNCRKKPKILNGDETQFASYFSWCGHVARLRKADPKRETSQIFMLKNLGVAAQSEERARIPMSWTEVQMGAGRCAVCWYRLDERGTGSAGVEGQDGCDDRVEKQKMVDRNASPIE